MKRRTCYYEPSGADIGGYRKPDRIKTSRDIIRCWADAGWQWASYNRAIDPEFVTVRRNLGLHGKQNDAKLYWRSITIAEHFETHTVIYANTPRSVHTVGKLVQDVLLNEANFTPVPQQEADKLHDSYLVIAKTDSRKAKDADRARRKRAKTRALEECHANKIAHIDSLSTEEAVELIFTNSYLEDQEVARRAKNTARKRSQRAEAKSTTPVATAQAEARQDAEASYYAATHKTVRSARKEVAAEIAHKAREADRARKNRVQAAFAKERREAKATLDVIFGTDE